MWPSMSDAGLPPGPTYGLAQCLRGREITGAFKKRQLVGGVLQERGLPYARWLAGHKGCVNGVAFSHSDCRLLASGSDDQRVLLWEAFEHRAHQRPVKEFTVDASPPRPPSSSCGSDVRWIWMPLGTFSCFDPPPPPSVSTAELREYDGHTGIPCSLDKAVLPHAPHDASGSWGSGPYCRNVHCKRHLTKWKWVALSDPVLF